MLSAIRYFFSGGNAVADHYFTLPLQDGRTRVDDHGDDTHNSLHKRILDWVGLVSKREGSEDESGVSSAVSVLGSDNDAFGFGSWSPTQWCHYHPREFSKRSDDDSHAADLYGVAGPGTNNGEGNVSGGSSTANCFVFNSASSGLSSPAHWHCQRRGKCHRPSGHTGIVIRKKSSSEKLGVNGTEDSGNLSEDSAGVANANSSCALGFPHRQRENYRRNRVLGFHRAKPREHRAGKRSKAHTKLLEFECEYDYQHFYHLGVGGYQELILPLKHKTSFGFSNETLPYDINAEKCLEGIGFYLAQATQLTSVCLSLGKLENELPLLLRGPFEQHSLEKMVIAPNFCKIDRYFRDNVILRNGDVECIGRYLECATSFKCLAIQRVKLTADAVTVLSKALGNVQPEELHLQDIAPNRVTSLLRQYCPTNLKSLRLNESTQQRDAIKAVANILRKTDSSLQELVVQCYDLDDLDVQLLLEVLAHNTTLKRLSLVGRGLTEQSAKNYVQLVYNDTSIDTVYDSNHVLPWVKGPFLDIVIKDTLRFTNRIVCTEDPNSSPWMRRRQKLVKFLAGGEMFNMVPFHPLDRKVLPYAIEFVGKKCPDEYSSHRDAFLSFDDLFQVIRNLNVGELCRGK